MNFNPYSRSHLGNPHPVYAALREEHPIHLNDRLRFWAISRYEDVENALREWPIFSSVSGITLDGFSGIKPMIILMDRPGTRNCAGFCRRRSPPSELAHRKA